MMLRHLFDRLTNPEGWEAQRLYAANHQRGVYQLGHYSAIDFLQDSENYRTFFSWPKKRLIPSIPVVLITDAASLITQPESLGFTDFHDPVGTSRQAPAFMRMIGIGGFALTDVYGVNNRFYLRRKSWCAG